MCAISIVSIILMIIANEITFNQPEESDTVAGWFVKLIIAILTAVLLILVLVYHRLDLDLYSINNSIDNWCVGLTHQRLFIVAVELMICAIHPMPRSYPINSQLARIQANMNTTETTPHSYSYVSIDAALGLPSE